MKTVGLAMLALLSASGCAASPNEGNDSSKPSNATAVSETYRSPQGVTYTVNRVDNLKQEELPQNRDFKMADSNLAKYAREACTLNAKPEYAPARCDIYVQPDKSGTLVGYAVVTQNKDGVRLSTATSLNTAKQPYGSTTCGVEGIIYGDGENYSTAIADSSQDFDGQIVYSAWEKDPGNWMVSQIGPNDQDDKQGSTGVWYIKKQGDKLRISQERWNYCYTDKGVQIDDVFTRAVILTRQTN